MSEYTVIPRTGVTPHEGDQIFSCDPLPAVQACSAPEAVEIALRQRENEWSASGRPGSIGTFQFAVIHKSNRGHPAVTIVDATVEVASVRVAETSIAQS